MMITYHQLQTFLTVVRTNSVTRAARELRTTQPTLSLQLQALRKYLGAPLLERLHGQLQLTPAGEKLRRYAEEALGGLRTLQQDVATLQGTLAGPLAVGFPYVMSRYVMPAVLSRFLERFPAVGVEIHVEFPEPMFSGLLRNSLDVMCYINIPAIPGVTVETLCEEPLSVVVSPNHPLACRRRVTAAELTTYPFIAPTSPSLRALIESKLRTAGIIPRVAAEARHADAIKKLVERGVGYSMIIRSAVAEELNSRRLVGLKLAGPPPRAELVAAYQSRPVISSLVRAFVDFVRAELLDRAPTLTEKPSKQVVARNRPVRIPGRKRRGPSHRVSGARTRSSRAGRTGSSS